MLEELKFVKGSVSKKDFVQSLTHFVIEHGTVRGFNGTIALCSPIPFDIECKPRADELVKAIEKCDATVALSLTPAGKLRVASGTFKALVACVDGPTPHALPSGQFVEVDGTAMLAASTALLPFIGDDAARLWTNGILFYGPSAFATNNVMLVEYWLGKNFPAQVIVPRVAVKEVVRIGLPPTHLQFDANSLTFHYAGGRWLRTQLITQEWQVNLSKILVGGENAKPIPEDFFKGLSKLEHFVDKTGRVLFTEKGLRTHASDEEGASFDIEGFGLTGAYNIDMLKKLSGVVKTIDFAAYPRPCIFFGDKLRGALVGTRT